MKYSSKATRVYDNPVKLEELRALIVCERPSVNLYKFVGNMTVYSEPNGASGVTMPLHIDNILLRGARLKDTEYVYGNALLVAVCFKVTIVLYSKVVRFTRGMIPS